MFCLTDSRAQMSCLNKKDFAQVKMRYFSTFRIVKVKFYLFILIPKKGFEKNRFSI